MLRQLLVSIAVSICNIAIHAIVMAAVLWVARIASERAMSYRSFRLIAIMTATVSVWLRISLKWSFGHLLTPLSVLHLLAPTLSILPS